MPCSGQRGNIARGCVCSSVLTKLRQRGGDKLILACSPLVVVGVVSYGGKELINRLIKIMPDSAAHVEERWDILCLRHKAATLRSFATLWFLSPIRYIS